MKPILASAMLDFRDSASSGFGIRLLRIEPMKVQPPHIPLPNFFTERFR